MSKNDLIKVLFIGDTGVGKSSLLLRYTEDKFTDVYMSTIGVDFKSKEHLYNDKSYRIQMWDTAGQERFRGVIGSYFRGAQVVIIVFDMTNKQSFENVNGWISDVHKYSPKLPSIILIGTKIDLTKQIVISDEEVKQFAKLHNMKYILTSSKTNNNVHKTFDMICDGYIEFINKFYIENAQFPQSNRQSVTLIKREVVHKNNCC